MFSHTLNKPLVSTQRAKGIMQWAGYSIAVVIFIITLVNTFAAQRKHEQTVVKKEYEKSFSQADNFAKIGLNESGNIVSWNHGATLLFGWDSKEMIGKSISRLTGDTSPFEYGIGNWLAEGKGELICADGHKQPVRINLRDTVTKTGKAFRTLYIDYPDKVVPIEKIVK